MRLKCTRMKGARFVKLTSFNLAASAPPATSAPAATFAIIRSTNVLSVAGSPCREARVTRSTS